VSTTVLNFVVAVFLLAAGPSVASSPADAKPALRQLTVDSPMAELLDNPSAREVLARELPALLAGPQIEQARPFSLRSLKIYVPTLITDEKLAAVDAELVRVKAMGSATVVAPAVPLDNREALTLTTVNLWDGPAPGALGEGPNDIPTLTVVRPDGATSFGTAVIVAPGGGYQGLATGHEGRQVADWFAAHGVTAFVLRYRLCPAGYRHPAQLQDAQRAIRWVRAHASEFGIDPGRVGMIGFSAGGHLTAMAETLFDSGDPAAADPVERYSSRPDFAVLAYAPTGSNIEQDAPLLCIAGENKPQSDLFPTRNVSAQSPPTFIFHTTADELVPSENAIDFYKALSAANVPAELHIFAEGRHGLGLALSDPMLGEWPVLLANWLRSRKLIGYGME
jgi:acetyl esterase/lipase